MIDTCQKVVEFMIKFIGNFNSNSWMICLECDVGMWMMTQLYIEDEIIDNF